MRRRRVIATGLSLLIAAAMVLIGSSLPGGESPGPAAAAATAAASTGAASDDGTFGGFIDVPTGHPYAAAIEALRQRGVVSGYLDDGRWLFKPGDAVLRAQFSKMICGALAIPVTEGAPAPFDDLGPNDPADLYPHDYVAAVAARAITTGTAPGRFSPWKRISRAQIVTMSVRAAAALAPDALRMPPDVFTGTVAPFDPHHDGAMRTAEWNGLLVHLESFGATWNPWTEASRGETAQVLFDLMELMGAADDAPVDVPGQPLGANVPISFRLFPADNPWNTDISRYPVHPLSDRYIASIGRTTGLHPDFGTVWEGAPIGIPYVVVSGSQPRVPISFYYADESDPGPYPIPPDAPIEGGPVSDGDRHVLVLDPAHNKLYEVYDAHFYGDHWEAGSGAVWDLNSNALRPDTWTSADAAGLPILPGLVRYDEVTAGEITHALRVTVSRTQRAFIHPATHFASSSTDPDLPPMGLRLRLRAGYDISRFPARVQVILRALKKYGLIVADNGGDWFISGAPDPRWDDEELHVLSEVPGSAFEAVDTGPIITTR